MSAMGQKRTCRRSFDHLVGASDERIRDVEAEDFCSLQIDSQAHFCSLLDRQVTRPLTLEKASGVNACLTIGLRRAVSIAHQTPGNDKVSPCVDRGNCV